MGDKVPKLEEGEITDKPFTCTASIRDNPTPQERLAALLRRIDTARASCKLGAVELRPVPASTDPLHVSRGPATVPTTGVFSGALMRSAAPSNTMFGFQGPSGFVQGYAGGNTGYGDGSSGPGPFQAALGGSVMAHGAGNPGSGPVPVVRGRGRDNRTAGPVQQLSSECQRRRFNPGK